MEILEAHKSLFNQEDYDIAVNICQNLGQTHLFSFWDDLGENDVKKQKLLKQLKSLDENYSGGLKSYIENSKQLLVQSRDGMNPYSGFVPSIPSGETVLLQPSTKDNIDAFVKTEESGKGSFDKLSICIVAGGLGERLGYSGIKLSLPCDLLTGTTFLGLYTESILAMEKCHKQRTGVDTQIPVAIMTSDDTHLRTVALLEKHNYFGLKKTQVDLIKQEKVPAIFDNKGSFAINRETYEVETKPHGHGDVHSLLFSTGIAKKWYNSGKRYLCFVQDTNILVFRSIPVLLGVTKKLNLAMNSLSIPRNKGEAIGAICRLVNEKTKQDMTINVEYNQLDGLIQNSGLDFGSNSSSKKSPFPGNTNVLLFNLEPYCKALEISKGTIPEFVNPKYADEERTSFKNPTRLECMMQDFPKLLTNSEVRKVIGEENVKIGFTMLNRFSCYSAAKNNLKDAKVKFEKTGYAVSMASCERAYYDYGVTVLNMLGAKVEKGAKLLFKSSFALTLQDIINAFPSPDKISISSRSSLLLSGDVVVNELEVDGALELVAEGSGKIRVSSLKIANKGISFVSLDGSEDESIAIRGYKLQTNEIERKIAKNGELLEI